jgi:hypothetical protein
VLVVFADARAGPRACRSLGAAGYRPIRAWLGPAPHVPWPVPPPFDLSLPGAASAGFVPAVRALCERERAVAVLPVSEDACRVLAPEAGRLGAVLIGPTEDQYRRLCDKAALAATAREAGVPHPETAAATAADVTLPRLPSVVKPAGSGDDARLAAAQIVRDAQERAAAVLELGRLGAEPLVQELVSGQPWSLHGVRSEAGLDAVAFRVERTHPRGAGTSSVHRSRPAPEGLLRGTERLLAHVGYRGPVSINAIERDGAFLFHDVNLRLSSSVAASIRSGLDVPVLAVDAALGRPRAPGPRRLRRITYVRADAELRALREGLRGGAAPGAARILADLARGALLPSWMLDPSPLDPAWLPVAAARRVARSGASGSWSRRRARSSGGRPPPSRRS